jgi:RNA-directed DNA polymerase
LRTAAKARTWKSGRVTGTSIGERDADRKAEMPEDSRKVAGGTFGGTGRERQAPAAGKGKTRPETKELMEGVLRQENLREALGRVRSNQGAPGVDGMSTEALVAYLRENWPRIREELAGGTYRPGPIRRVDIPKPDGKGVSEEYRFIQ